MRHSNHTTLEEQTALHSTLRPTQTTIKVSRFRSNVGDIFAFLN